MGMTARADTPLRLLICDDAPELRAMLRAQLAGHPRLEVVGEAENGEQAVELAIALAPDAVLMDVEMPILDGVEATRRIRAVLPETRVVAFAGSDDSGVVMAMIEAGAGAYCTKRAGVWELERALTGVSDPVLRIASALARSVPGRPRAELAAEELKRVTGAREVVVYLPQQQVDDAPSVAAQAVANAAPARSGDSLAVPLIAEGETLGALVVHGVDLDLDLDVVAAVADLTAAALAADRRIAVSAAEARRDLLTGLGNRRAFDERLDVALASDDPASVLLLDLDDFKHINDTRGHAAGDRVLRQVAVTFQREARAGEDVFRIGGEEFAVVVDGDVSAAFRVAARMRAALARQRRGEPLPTLSAGIAAAPEHARTRDQLLAAADAALYAAKWSGKDRVLVFGSDGRTREVAVSARAHARILVVDDDHGLRTLLRATFEAADVEITEARDVAAATAAIERSRPDVVVLDIAMPGVDGMTFCHALKADPDTCEVGVVLLTGSDAPDLDQRAADAGADALVRKPFSPIDLLSVIEDVLAGGHSRTLQERVAARPEEQLLLYADDLRRLLELERGQRALLQRAYRDTVTALASALESKDSGTGAHSERVQQYAVALTRAVEPALLGDSSLEYGFLLHDIGKIGVPDRILLKPRSLSRSELRLMQMHTVLGEQMLGGVALLQGEGLRVVRSHHERWDGRGYPDGLAGETIPLSARIFSVADTLDAVMSKRPYRAARPWEAAREEIDRAAGAQFDPGVVAALHACEQELRDIAGAFAVDTPPA
jgi:diguanylate cyclase (GGDEF)-like protein